MIELLGYCVERLAFSLVQSLDDHDGEHQKVFEGVINWVGGGDGIYMNYRFAQPGRTLRRKTRRQRNGTRKRLWEVGVVSMYSIDTTTRKLTSLGTVDAGGGVLAAHPSGKFVYAAGGPAFSPGVVSVYMLNATTGVLASNGTAPTGLYPIAIAIAPSGKFAYVANYNSHSISMYAIDAVTGTLTLIGTIGT